MWVAKQGNLPLQVESLEKRVAELEAMVRALNEPKQAKGSAGVGNRRVDRVRAERDDRPEAGGA